MTHPVHYRKALATDIPSLIKLRIDFLKEVSHAEVIPDRLEKDLETFFLQHLPQGDFVCWLAECGNEIVSTGAISFQTFPPSFVNETGDKAYILNVYTLESFRRQGISKGVFAKLMEEIRDRGISQISLHATEAGRAMYEQFGFIGRDTEMIWGNHI